MGFIRKIRSSINLKVISITFIGVTSALLIWLIFAIISFGNLREGTSQIIDKEIEGLVYEYYGNYIGQVSANIDQYVENIFSEIHLLSGIAQTWFSRRAEFGSLTGEMDKTDYFRDYLKKGDAWIDNDPDEPTELFVPRYLLNDDLSMPSEIRSLVDDTRFMDLVLPVFASQGIKKVQVFYQGGKNREIFRMSPWYGIGENIYAIYPEMNVLPIWDTFNPGLAEQWEELIGLSGGDRDKINRLARVTPPVQDGLSGEIVLTVSQPIAGNDFTTFEGTISYDIPIEYIIDFIENIRFSRTGFAFLAQSNGNIFGINDYGQEIFGLAGYNEATVDEGEGFNRLERFLSDSRYEDVQQLSLDSGDEPVIDTVSIQEKDYFLVLKKLEGYQSWLPEKSFFREQWTLGFAIPREEVLKAQYIVDDEISRQMNNLRVNSIGISAIIITFLLALLYFLINRVVTRLGRMAAAAEEISARNYDVELPVDTIDEVGWLSRTFNSMIREIRKNISQLSSEVDESRENEQKYITLFESVPDPVIVCGTGRSPLYINTAFTKVFGWTIAELKKRKSAMIEGGYPDKLTPAIPGQTFETRAETSAGDWVDVSITSAPFLDSDGNRIGSVYNMRDVTQWKKTRELMIQSEKVLTFGNLASGMAHDIRNPLAGAAQNAQNIYNRLFGDSRKNDETADNVGISREKMNLYLEERGIPKMINAIVDSVKDANRSIDYMLSFNINKRPTFRSADMVELMEESLKVAEFNMRKISDFSKITINRNFEDYLPSVVCDTGKMEQVFLNILKNSVEAFETASTENPEFHLNMRKNGNFLVIEIIDNGPGMTEDIRDRIFEPFFSMGKGGPRRGLGLAVTHYIVVENHKGTLAVQSNPGEGTSVTIQIPVKGPETEL